MGILHFAGLGRSAGAVTAGLSYVRHCYGLHHDQYGNMVQKLVIFTSPDVADGRTSAFAAEHNEYGRRSVRKRWAAEKTKAVEIVVAFMEREFPATEVYLAELDINSFGACFETVATALLKFHAPDQVGDHTWVNITGGSNMLNAALNQCAYLSGVIARLYYTFVGNIQRDGKFLQPFSDRDSEFRFGEIFPIKTRFGERHRQVLEKLEQLDQKQPGRYVSSGDLLSQLKGESPDFRQMENQFFLRNFLNVMHGIEQAGDRQSDQQDAVRLSPEGRRILDLIRRPLFRALVLREPLPDADRADVLERIQLKKLN